MEVVEGVGGLWAWRRRVGREYRVRGGRSREGSAVCGRLRAVEVGARREEIGGSVRGLVAVFCVFGGLGCGVGEAL